MKGLDKIGMLSKLGLSIIEKKKSYWVLFIRTAGSITAAANRQAIDVTAREDGQDWV
jgi:hypothetical protein